MVVLYDAHCHLSAASFKAFDNETLSSLIVAKIRRNTKDNEEPSAVYQCALMSTNQFDAPNVLSLSESCASKYLEASLSMSANTRLQIIPCLGIHPWYSHMFYTDESAPDKKLHYNMVLESVSKKYSDATDELLESLPDPVSLDEFCQYVDQEVQRKLKSYSSLDVCPILIGEIGIDKLSRIPWAGFLGNEISVDLQNAEETGVETGFPELSPFKVSMKHQLVILKKQFDIATKNNIPVSIHCVKAHGVLYNFVVNYIKESQGIPAICLHSYTGSKDQAYLWVNLKKKLPNSIHERSPKIYFSFSHILNNNSSNTKKIDEADELISFLPDDTLLIETDLSIDKFYKKDGNLHYSSLLDITRKICKCKNWDITQGTMFLKKNWNEFLKIRGSQNDNYAE